MLAKRSKGQDVLQAIYDFADQYQEKPGRLAREQQESQFTRRHEALEEAERARRAILEEDQAFERGQRDREASQRSADAELRGLLAAEATKRLRPTGVSSPRMAALGQAGQPPVGGLFPGSTPLDPDAEIAAAENRKWDRFQTIAPQLSPEGAKMLFGYLQEETNKKLLDARYGALARRVGQLTMPAKSPGGSEMPGLDPEDPEQSELLAQLQGMIDQKGDPKAINEVLAKLEGEQKRDRLRQIKREGRLGQMEEALTTFPSFASQEEIDAAHEIYLDLQRDQTRDVDDAWEEFRTQLFGGRSRWTNAYEQASKLTLKDEYEPRLPTEAEVFEVGAVLYPHDPRFRTDVAQYPRSPLEGDESGAAVPSRAGAGGGGPAPEPVPPSMALVGKGAVPPSFGQPPARMAPSIPPTPEVRAAREHITPELMETMGKAVDAATSPAEADQALAGLARKAGVKPEDLPDWLLKTLFQRFQSAQAGRRGFGKTLGGQPATMDPTAGPPAAPPSMALVGEGALERPETGPEMPAPRPRGTAPQPRGAGPNVAKVTGRTLGGRQATLGEPEAEVAQAPVPRSMALVGATPEDVRPAPSTLKRWKRMQPAEQKEAESQLKAAIAKAERFDFHGALAPVLRKLGIDLGSLPKDVAQRLRDALKKQRAKRT